LGDDYNHPLPQSPHIKGRGSGSSNPTLQEILSFFIRAKPSNIFLNPLLVFVILSKQIKYYSKVFSSHSFQKQPPKKSEGFLYLSIPHIPFKALLSLSLITPKETLYLSKHFCRSLLVLMTGIGMLESNYI
jgi:hypothetical protein